MVVQVSGPLTLGSDSPRLRFGEAAKPEAAWAGGRLMLVDENPAYELSFPCGTCQFLFRRLACSHDTLSIDDLRGRLAHGLDTVDLDVVASFGQLLGRGTYLPLLMTVEPRLVAPGEPGDYFAEEEFVTWGAGWYGKAPEDPGTSYYRTFETRVAPEAHLYEFVVPMLPPARDDPATLAKYAGLLASSSAPTAVAVSVLDVCAPAVAPDGTDWYEHWGLTHFLLDGHHKVHAAAEAGQPVQLLSLLSVDASLAAPEQVSRVPELRERPRGGRGSSRPGART